MAGPLPNNYQYSLTGRSNGIALDFNNNKPPLALSASSNVVIYYDGKVTNRSNTVMLNTLAVVDTNTSRTVANIEYPVARENTYFGILFKPTNSFFTSVFINNNRLVIPILAGYGISPTPTQTPTRTPTRTPVITRTRTPTPTSTPSRTRPSITRTPTPSRTRSPITQTPTNTQPLTTPILTGLPTTPTPTPTATISPLFTYTLIASGIDITAVDNINNIPQMLFKGAPGCVFLYNNTAVGSLIPNTMFIGESRTQSLIAAIQYPDVSRIC